MECRCRCASEICPTLGKQNMKFLEPLRPQEFWEQFAYLSCRMENIQGKDILVIEDGSLFKAEIQGPTKLSINDENLRTMYSFSFASSPASHFKRNIRSEGNLLDLI